MKKKYSLHQACRNNNLAIVRQLLKCEDVNAIKDSKTALAISIELNNIHVVEQLLSCDSIDINKVCDNGQSPLSLSIVYKRHTIFDMLLNDERLNMNNNIHILNTIRDKEFIKTLVLCNKVSPWLLQRCNLTLDNEHTAEKIFKTICQSNNKICTTKLFMVNSSVFCEPANFFLACSYHASNLIKVFVEHNVNPNVYTSDDDNVSLLQFAINTNDYNTIKALVCHPNLNMDITYHGLTIPYIIISQYMIPHFNVSIPILKLLLEHPRVDLHKHSIGVNHNKTLFEAACQCCNHELYIKLCLLTVIQQCKTLPTIDNMSRVANTLVQQWHRNPDVIWRWRSNIGEPISELYTQVVLLCDNYLLLKTSLSNNNNIDTRYIRWYNIITKLPIELQMLLCHRIYHSDGHFIHSKMFEAQANNIFSHYHEEYTLNSILQSMTKLLNGSNHVE